ncbi:calmodulin, striated muscle [Histomonas meleagridis]|uniref:calmodulin, striated muscle n=1 Tax=Histomonas meleagridis TaxID=135588 RepID=UPI00355A4347|nr:calmodulin, striated muscle [Histomonas meleagridis]KAH0798678.1 calmodulin, striated muscle [Histomonas meleagridis]
MTVCDCFSDKQLKTFQKAFQKTDKDGDGYLALKDIKKVFKLLKINTSSEDLNNIVFREFRQGEQKFDVIDLIRILYYYLRYSDSQEELARAFAAFDTDHDGKVSVDLVNQVLSNINNPLSKELIDEILGSLDTSNGLVDYKELANKLNPK